MKVKITVLESRNVFHKGCLNGRLAFDKARIDVKCSQKNGLNSRNRNLRGREKCHVGRESQAIYVSELCVCVCVHPCT